jgi:hypothetical protein
MAEVKNLMQGLLEEMNRVREIIKEYESLPELKKKTVNIGGIDLLTT